MKPSVIDFAPQTQLLVALHRRDLGYARAMSELVDNAFDAGAARVAVVADDGRLDVFDDGAGCGDLQRLLQLGNHYAHDIPGLGINGVGLKEVASWFWGKFQVMSCWEGKILSLAIDWDHIVRTNLFRAQPEVFDDSESKRRELNIHNGWKTRITFKPGARRNVRNAVSENVRNELAFRYCPALLVGRQILIGKSRASLVPLTAWIAPRLDERFEHHGEFLGEPYVVKGGILASDAINTNPGFVVAFRHRVILETQEPCGAHGAARFFAWVELLGDEWRTRFSTNKDGLSEGIREALFAQLQGDCEPWLKRAARQASQLSIANLNEFLSAAVTSSLEYRSERAEVHLPRGNTGSHPAPGTSDKKRDRAAQSQPGERPIRISGSGGVRIAFDRLPPERLYRAVDGGLGLTINIDHPYVKAAYELKRLDLQHAMLLPLALGIVAHEISLDERQDWERRMPVLAALDRGEWHHDVLWRSSKFLTERILGKQKK